MKYPSNKATRNFIAEYGEKIKLVKWIVRRPYTMVECHLQQNGTVYFGYGFAKVMQPDIWDSARGGEIAHFRACKDIFTQALEDGDFLIGDFAEDEHGRAD